MTYKPGETIHDPEGNEWTIARSWDYKQYLCLWLVGTSKSVAGQVGGFRTEYEEGGLTVNVR